MPTHSLLALDAALAAAHDVHALVDAVRPDELGVLPVHDAGSTQLDLLAATALANLATTAANADPSTLFAWRHLHTDACVLAALVSPPSDAIAKLDTAIIVSGAAGKGRLDLILDLIQRIQSQYWPSPGLNSYVSQLSSLPPFLAPVPVIPSRSSPPSLTAFQTYDYKAPFIVRDHARHWPALNERPWASIDYLRAVAGPARIVPVEVGRDYRTDDWSQKLIPWDDFLDSLDAGDEVLYLAQHSLLMQFPDLRADIEVPDYVYAALPRQPGSEPPANDEQLVINLWLGPKGTVSPAHTDPYYNMYVQVVGYKTVWVAPPSCSAGMYANGNTAEVDVFATDQRHRPKFTEHVAGRGMSERLGPGDMLYLPAGWWHAMRGESRSSSISMWF
ncbi:hypothetical protein B0H15DRAFT_838071 [Mycena belliarum]|uniref:JmjC domain-containing protein n=1 Tax=Mycena belliarum TaxID=1033014 RepID=A0AAD6U9G5_9AGAR|nr:hypothetical protein B0H15DRAFT_838071 [Mycena belliae]